MEAAGSDTPGDLLRGQERYKLHQQRIKTILQAGICRTLPLPHHPHHPPIFGAHLC